MLEDQAALTEERRSGQVEMEQTLLREPVTGGRRSHGRKQVVQRLNVLAAVLIAGLLIGGSIALFTNRSPSTTTRPVGSPVTVRAEAGGLEMSLSITPGPYFLSKLILAHMSLTNQSHTTFLVAGSESGCFPALRLSQTGGENPHYRLPLHFEGVETGCLGRYSTLEPDQTITNQTYEPLVSSGLVTLTAQAHLWNTKDRRPGPLDGHWPSLQVQVASHIPSDRLFSLRLQGSQVFIEAPPTLHLLYWFTASCVRDGMSAYADSPWHPIAMHVLNVPGDLVRCPVKDVRWQYVVSAAGYAIVGGSYPA
jgi:hypothetical protein